MDKIESLLRSAKPSVPDLADDFSSQVIKRIQAEKILIKRAALNPLQQKARIGLALLALVVSLILFNYNAYELKMNGSLELLYFGTKYLTDFVTYLPWDLILSSLLLTAFAVWMIRKSRLLKRGIAVIAVISYLITGFGGVVLASTNLNESLEAGIEKREDSHPWLAIFHNDRAGKFINHPHMKLGKVESVVDGKALVITPQGEQLHIQLPGVVQVEAGQVIRISGQDRNAFFSAHQVHICNPNRVGRYFHHMNHHGMMPCCSNGGMMMMR